jgi:hypothetical protein
LVDARPDGRRRRRRRSAETASAVELGASQIDDPFIGEGEPLGWRVLDRELIRFIAVRKTIDWRNGWLVATLPE